MPRSNRSRRSRRPGKAAEPDLGTGLLRVGGRLEEHADGDWRVRPVTGAAATKAYLCPGCRQAILPGTPHVVAWPAEQLGAFGGPGDRRHWHTPCWAARSHRR